MNKRVFLIALTVSLLFLSRIQVRAEETVKDSTSYPMLADRVEGTNIETFYIERPDPEALKNNTVYAADFGLNVNNEDNYGAFSEALTYCRNHPNTCLVIEQGVYYFKENKTLQLTGFQNVLIEGNGAEFIFENRKQFALNGCNGVEIRNLIVDWNWEKDRIASLVKVQNKTDHSFEIKFMELEEVSEDIPLVSFQQYDNKDLVPGNYGSWKTFNPAEVPGSILSVEKVEPNVLRIEYSASFTTAFHNEEVYILRHYTYGGSVFNVYGNSCNITFNNVRIYGSAGMGYTFSDKSNHFQIINSYIGLRPGAEDKQRMSTTADGIHILNTDGYFRIDNCDFSYTGDDLINVHDDMLYITKITDGNKLNGNVTGGFASKGDTIRIYNSNMEDLGFETEVVSCIRSSDTASLTLKDPLPAEVKTGFYVYRSSSSTHNYVISNNYFHETKGRGALLNASDALFENNRLYRTVSESVQVRVDVAGKSSAFWYEGIGASNIVIRNNLFEECAFGGKADIITIDCNTGTKKDVLSDIRISDNTFSCCYGELINADNVSELYIENNIISDSGEIKSTAYCGTVYIGENTICHPSENCQHTDTKQVQNRQPNCFTYGSTGKTYCNECRTIINSNVIGLSPLNHKNMAVKRIDTAPACTETGLSSRICSLCQTVLETGIEEPATGHYFVAESGNCHKCSACGITEEHDGEGADGVCGVCGYGMQVRVVRMSLELDGEDVDFLGINLYAEAPKGTTFLVDGNRSSAVISSDNGLTKICFASTPKELSNIHVLTAIDSANQPTQVNHRDSYTFSGDMYCSLVLSAKEEYSDELIKVCSSLLAYSQQAGAYFDTGNAGAASENVAANLPAKGYGMVTSGELPGGCEYLGSTLILGERVILRHYFRGDVDRFSISCTDKANGSKVSISTGHVSAARIGYVDIPLSYLTMGDMFELKMYTAGNSTPYTLRYGAVTYCLNAAESNTDRDLTKLCNALYNFSAAISNYKKSVQG